MSVHVGRGHVKVLSFQEHLPACFLCSKLARFKGFHEQACISTSSFLIAVTGFIKAIQRSEGVLSFCSKLYAMQVWSVPLDWLGSWKLKGNKKTCCYSTLDKHFPRLLGVCCHMAGSIRIETIAMPHLHNLTSHRRVGVLVFSFMQVFPSPLKAACLVIRVEENNCSLGYITINTDKIRRCGSSKFCRCALIFVRLLQQARQSLISSVPDQSSSKLQCSCFRYAVCFTYAVCMNQERFQKAPFGTQVLHTVSIFLSTCILLNPAALWFRRLNKTLWTISTIMSLMRYHMKSLRPFFQS